MLVYNGTSAGAFFLLIITDGALWILDLFEDGGIALLPVSKMSRRLEAMCVAMDSFSCVGVVML